MPIKLINGYIPLKERYRMYVINQYMAGGDADADAFISAAGIIDSTQIAAINGLVSDLKNYILWDKIVALYPFVGGAANSHKFNLKDPRDADAAYRLSYVNTITHNSAGVAGNGTSSYCNTHLLANFTTQNDIHFGVYMPSITLDNRPVIGNVCGNITSQSNIFPNANGLFYRVNSSNDSSVTTSLTGGFMVANRVGSTETRNIKNSTIATKSTASNGVNTVKPFTICAVNFEGGASFLYSSKTISFASIGKGLTDTDLSNYYTAVQTYQTVLSRNV